MQESHEAAEHGVDLHAKIIPTERSGEELLPPPQARQHERGPDVEPAELVPDEVRCRSEELGERHPADLRLGSSFLRLGLK